MEMTLAYTKISQGFNAGNLVPSSDVDSFINTTEKDYYYSLYQYNEEHYNKFQATKSLSGIRDVTTDKLWWDFDDKASPENARKDALEIVGRLEVQGVPTSDIEIYFSGNKGYHVLVTTESQHVRAQVESYCFKLANGLKTFDTTMYDENQVLRYPGTKHNSSGLYKVPLTKTQLLQSNESHKALAKSLNNITEEFSWNVVSINLPPVPVVIKKENKTMIDESAKKPNNWRNCKWNILQGNFPAGQRHEALMVLAATCRGLNFDRDTAYYMCKSALKKQSAITGDDEFPKEELYENIIESVYKPDWNGGAYTCQKSGWLQKYCQSLDCPCDNADKDDMKVFQIGDIETEFLDYVDHIEENTILTGIRELDEAIPLSIGMNLGLLGGPGSGKTAICLKILENTSNAGVVSVMASLDMHRNRLYLKLLLKESGMSRDELITMFKDRKHSPVTDKIKEKYKNVWFYDRSSPSVDDIRRYILEVEANTGQKVKLLMVDYFERINSERSDDTAASKEVAGKLQDLLNDLSLCIVTLVQPNKFSLSAGPDQPILNYTAIKGSSFLYQAFRGIVSLWRPFYTPELKHNDRFLQMAILKNDLGELDMFSFGWTGKTGDIYSLSEEQEMELKQLLNEKEGKKKDSAGGWD
jgi:hypothetical protein